MVESFIKYIMKMRNDKIGPATAQLVTFFGNCIVWWSLNKKNKPHCIIRFIPTLKDLRNIY